MRPLNAPTARRSSGPAVTDALRLELARGHPRSLIEVARRDSDLRKTYAELRLVQSSATGTFFGPAQRRSGRPPRPAAEGRAAGADREGALRRAHVGQAEDPVPGRPRRQGGRDRRGASRPGEGQAFALELLPMPGSSPGPAARDDRRASPPGRPHSGSCSTSTTCSCGSPCFIHPSHASIDLTWPPAATKWVLSTNRPPFFSASFRCCREVDAEVAAGDRTHARLSVSAVFASGDRGTSRIGMLFGDHQVGRDHDQADRPLRSGGATIAPVLWRAAPSGWSRAGARVLHRELREVRRLRSSVLDTLS